MTSADGAPVLGAHVAGWPANVLHKLLAKYVDPHMPRYLGVMDAVQRQEVQRTREAIALAAAFWDQSTTADDLAEVTSAETPRGWTHDEITTADAAGLLGVTERRVRQLIPQWADSGLARKVGRFWLVDREAVLLHRDQTRSAA